MSIQNLLTALQEGGGEEKTVESILRGHLLSNNNFLIKKVPPLKGRSVGLFVLDLGSTSVDALYIHSRGYMRFRDFEDLLDFLSLFEVKQET